jgi:hypothetical protein
MCTVASGSSCLSGYVNQTGRVVPLWPGAPKVRVFAVRHCLELVRLFPNGREH